MDICCNVLVLNCLSTLFATTFYLNVCDNNDGVQAYMTQLTWFMYAAFHKTLYRYPSRDTAKLDVVLLQIY